MGVTRARGLLWKTPPPTSESRQVPPGFLITCERPTRWCADLLGRFDVAIHHYESAADLLLRWGMRPAHVINRMRLARTLLERGLPADSDRIRDLLDKSLDEAAEMGLAMPIVAQSQALRETL